MENIVGNAIKNDNTTLHADWGNYACGWVEVNLSAPIIPCVSMLGCFQ